LLHGVVAHTVLVVDGDAAGQSGLRRALRGEPYVVLAAEDAPAGLRALEAHAADAVVADLGVLDLVRERHPGTILIGLVAPSDLEAAMRAINRGEVHRFFVRPCAAEELALAVREGIQQRDLLVESRRLLHTVRRQTAVLDELEREVRGMAHGSRDPSGTVALADVPSDLDALLVALQAEVRAVDQRLREQEREIRRRSEEAVLGRR
jgi:DNA-binding NtrC family response regulator